MPYQCCALGIAFAHVRIAQVIVVVVGAALRAVDIVGIDGALLVDLKGGVGWDNFHCGGDWRAGVWGTAVHKRSQGTLYVVGGTQAPCVHRL